MVADKQMDLNQMFYLQSPTGLSTIAPPVFTRYVPSSVKAQPDLGFQSKTGKGIPQPGSSPRPQFAQRSPGSESGGGPGSCISAGSPAQLTLPEPERLKHRLLQGLNGRASEAYLLRALKSAIGTLRPRAGEAVSPTSHSKSEMSQNQMRCVPVIAWRHITEQQ